MLSCVGFVSGLHPLATFYTVWQGRIFPTMQQGIRPALFETVGHKKGPMRARTTSLSRSSPLRALRNTRPIVRVSRRTARDSTTSALPRSIVSYWRRSEAFCARSCKPLVRGLREKPPRGELNDRRYFRGEAQAWAQSGISRPCRGFASLAREDRRLHFSRAL